MGDLSSMLSGKGSSGFMPDIRFAALRDMEDELPDPLAVMRLRFGQSKALSSAPEPASFEAEHGAEHGAEHQAEPDPAEILRNEAYSQGWADAQAAAEQSAAQADQARGRLELAMHRLDGEWAEQFRQRLMETVIALCESCLAPLALDKEALLRRVEKAAAMFTRADDDRLIRLHPDDLAVIRARLPNDWDVQPDPAMERGAIRVESRSGNMEAGGAEDGPQQWRRAIIEALDVGGLD